MSSTDFVHILPLGFSKPTCQVSRDEARAMKATGKWYFANSGRELREVGQRFTPTLKSAQRACLGWKPFSPAWRAVALNEGKATHTGAGEDSQFHHVASYPIRYGWEGHITEMRVSDVNRFDRSPA